MLIEVSRIVHDALLWGVVGAVPSRYFRDGGGHIRIRARERRMQSHRVLLVELIVMLLAGWWKQEGNPPGCGQPIWLTPEPSDYRDEPGVRHSLGVLLDDGQGKTGLEVIASQTYYYLPVWPLVLPGKLGCLNIAEQPLCLPTTPGVVVDGNAPQYWWRKLWNIWVLAVRSKVR